MPEPSRGRATPQEGRSFDQRSVAEVARDGYAAWNSGDLETMLQFVHPELQWVTSGVFPGIRPTYSGHAGFREFWADFVEPWKKLQIEIDELYELDEQSLLMRVRFHAVGRDGIEADLPITNHLVMRDQMLYRFKGYGDWEQALADLGIEDPRGRADAGSS